MSCGNVSIQLGKALNFTWIKCVGIRVFIKKKKLFVSRFVCLANGYRNANQITTLFLQKVTGMLIKTRKTERINIKRKSQPKYTIQTVYQMVTETGDKRKIK